MRDHPWPAWLESVVELNRAVALQLADARAEAEFVVRDELWPDFDRAALEALDWQGRPWTPSSPEKAAHPNSRFTTPPHTRGSTV